MKDKQQGRRQEILSATAKLYETIPYRDINLKAISQVTSISRPSIYNYFKTKEEIFLTLLEEEYRCWAQELLTLAKEPELSKEGLAQNLAQSLADRPLMVKLIANNMADFEDNSRDERIISFKAAYGQTLLAMDQALSQVLPDWSESRREDFIYSFFPYLFGLYPYTQATAKQKMAVEKAGVPFKPHSVYNLIYHLVRALVK
ncbi:TetR family transcriptional regulator [Streptococcus downei]|uniref:TetR-type transcriptional regulator n=1 Tax=Streptococcus downei MFe28 TaxID=764290 RepID=A0A380JDM2_STRDO|nr:TetR family transcriptional regulator [Streptococcus downei]SUN36111.1 TetR-type transcriptional regulator [Streptococcus downei MFe28]